MSNTKFFITLALILGIIAASAEIGSSLLGLNKKPTDIIPPEQILPDTFDEEIVTRLNDRAEKYLLLKIEDFENGIDPDKVAPTPTPTVTSQGSL